MLRKILRKFQYVRELEDERDEYQSLYLQTSDIDMEENNSPVTAQAVVEKVMNRGIKWFDYNSLSTTEKKQYYADAQNILRNKTLANEINHLIADAVEFLARDAQNFDQVKDMRMEITALELLRERLSNLEDPEKRKIEFDENAIL